MRMTSGWPGTRRGMGRGMRVVVAMAALAAGAAAVAQEKVLLSVKPGGSLEIKDEKRLRIKGVRGEVDLRTGKPGEIRFLSAMPGPRGEPVPIALSRTGNELILEPIEGTPEVPRLLQVSLPPSFGASLDLADTKISATGLENGLDVRGARLDISARKLLGQITAALEAGKLIATDVGGGVTLEASQTDLALTGVAGLTSVKLVEGKAELRQIRAELDADTDSVAVTAADIGGPIVLRALRGSVELSGLEQGGEIRVRGTLLKIFKSHGDIQIESDNEIQLAENDAAMHVLGNGALVRGVNNRGLLEVKTFDAEVSIDKMAGPVRIQGERLRLTLKQIEGEVGIYTSASLVQLDGATGDVSIENQDGDVLARKVNGRLEVNGRGGSVRLLELGSAVSADVESQTLEVGWATLQGGQDSTLRNGSGGATVRLPPNAKCRIEAETKTGRIQSAVASVRVSDDGKAAAGSIGDAQAPVIRIEADGNIAFDAVKAPPPVPPARPVRRP